MNSTGWLILIAFYALVGIIHVFIIWLVYHGFTS